MRADREEEEGEREREITLTGSNQTGTPRAKHSLAAQTRVSGLRFPSRTASGVPLPTPSCRSAEDNDDDDDEEAAALKKKC